MTTRFYSSVATETTLVGGISAVNTSMQVQSVSGLPIQYPYVMAVDYEGATEELVEVTAAAGTTLSINRAYDGTPAASHNTGARVRHVSSAQDFRDSRNHENASSGAHGVTGSIVGTTDTQTLSAKTLANPTINSATVSGTVSGDFTLPGTVSGAPTFSGQALFTGNPKFQRANAADPVLTVQVNTPAVPHFVMGADGVMNWSDGTNPADTTLARLSVGDGLHVGGAFSTASDLQVNNGSLTVVDDRSFLQKGTTVNGQGAGNSSLIVTDVVGQTGPLTTWINGADTVAEVSVGGQANFASSTSGSGIATAAAGWTLQYERVVIKAGVATLNIGFTRTGGTITASATGDITDTQFGTIQAAYLPDPNFIGNTMWFNYSTGIAGGTSELNASTGVFTINTLNGGASILNTHTIRMTVTYPLVGP